MDDLRGQAVRVQLFEMVKLCMETFVLSYPPIKNDTAEAIESITKKFLDDIRAEVLRDPSQADPGW